LLHAVTLVLDVAAIAAALVASWLWYRAGQRQTRRISRLEVLDAADLNRVVTAINRSAILNKRAALASAFSAACFALRFAATLLVDLVELG
jgi:hypothetical protein